MSTLAPLKAYFDETGTHEGAPLVCVASYLFDSDAAVKFKALHAERVRPLLPVSAHGIFHAASCFGRRDEFDSLTRAQSNNIFAAMVEVLKVTMTYGMLTEIEAAIYDAEIKRLGRQVRRMVGSAYSICAIKCAENVAEWLTKRGIAGDVHYFFEAGNQYAGEAAHFFQTN